MENSDVYMTLVLSDKPCQICLGRPAVEYDILNIRGVLCCVCMAKMIQDTRKELQEVHLVMAKYQQNGGKNVHN